MDQLIKIKLTKCTLCLTEAELRQLLRRDQVIYARAIIRGKAIQRSETHKARAAAKFKNYVCPF